MSFSSAGRRHLAALGVCHLFLCNCLSDLTSMPQCAGVILLVNNEFQEFFCMTFISLLNQNIVFLTTYVPCCSCGGHVPPGTVDRYSGPSHLGVRLN